MRVGMRVIVTMKFLIIWTIRVSMFMRRKRKIVRIVETGHKIRRIKIGNLSLRTDIRSKIATEGGGIKGISGHEGEGERGVGETEGVRKERRLSAIKQR
jgi:hypothetical protein